MTMSASRVRSARSGTAECTTVTAALAPGALVVSSSDSGLPRVGPRPITTTCLPLMSMS